MGEFFNDDLRTEFQRQLRVAYSGGNWDYCPNWCLAQEFVRVIGPILDHCPNEPRCKQLLGQIKATEGPTHALRIVAEFAGITQ